MASSSSKRSRNETADCGTLSVECIGCSSPHRIWKSPAIAVGGVIWNASISVRIQGSKRFFSAKFECNGRDRMLADVTYHIAEQNNASPFTRSTSLVLPISQLKDNSYLNVCYNDIVEFDFVMDESNGLVDNGKLIIEIRIAYVKRDKIFENLSNVETPSPSFDFAKPIDFTNGADPRHDIAFVIRDKKIYAGKQILAAHSPYFAEMFYNTPTNENEIELELQFLDFLRVLYPSTEKISDYNVHYLLKLADRFQVKLIVDLAEKFFISSTEDDIPTKLLFADRYNLPQLKNHCFSAFTKKEDLKCIEEKTHHYKDLSDMMKIEVLEKYVEIVRKENEPTAP